MFGGQANVLWSPQSESVKKLSQKILKIEHKLYPAVVDLFVKKRISIKKNKVLIKNIKNINSFIKNI